MKKALFALGFVAVLLLSSCRSVSFDAAVYERIVGQWMVDKTTRPGGWQDAMYTFGPDKEFRIVYDQAAPFVGTVTGVDEESIAVVHTPPNSTAPSRMVMCYKLDSAGTSMQLGWYDGFIARYYLALMKR
jgi:hypothetical protein